MVNAQELLGPFAHLVSYNALTKVQKQVLPYVLDGNDSIVVSAPTGSGKTLILEVAIMHFFRERLLDSASSNDRSCASPSSSLSFGKAVYICPIKALANEKYDHWTSLFSVLKVVIETGDQDQAREGTEESLEAIYRADIIITTPERWDSITRKWKEKNVFNVVNTVSLLLLDEIHTLNEDRGTALEAIVSRMKAIKSGTEKRTQTLRVVAVSGTLPNADDLGAWIGAPKNMIFSFSSEDRPVPLTIRVLPFQNESNNPFAFDRFLSFKMFNLIREHAEGRPSIVFCSTRKQTVSSAEQLVKNIKEMALRNGNTSQLEPSPEVRKVTDQIIDKQLRSFAALGIAFHHAALALNDRRIIEQMYRDRFIAVVCTTTTLSLGVNLPAHLVIVKGTTFYSHGNWVDIPLSEVAQMCGRAGRPGLDDHGVALVLTTASKYHLYENLASGSAGMTVVESQLHQHIIEHVNAEVALRTIHTHASAMDWAKTTFFWLRLNTNPEYYGIKFASEEDKKAFNASRYLELLLEKVISALQDAKCVEVSNDSSSVMLESTLIGRSMSRLYISFGTVAHCNTVYEERTKAVIPVERFSIKDALQLLSQSDEFSDIHIRQGDKNTLNHLNKLIKYPLSNGFKGGREIREDWHKISVMIQAHLMGHSFSDMSLRNDMYRLLNSVQRVARFLKDYATSTQSYSFVLAMEQLRRSLEKRVWPDGLVMRQLKGVTEDVARTLMQAGIHSFSDLLAAEPHKVEAICSKPPPFGTLIREEAQSIPKLLVSVQKINTTEYAITVNVDVCVPSQRKSKEQRWSYHLLAGDSGDNILLSRTISISPTVHEPCTFQFASKSKDNSIFVHLLAQTIIGADYYDVIYTPSSEKSNEIVLAKPKKSKTKKDKEVQLPEKSCTSVEIPVSSGEEPHLMQGAADISISRDAAGGETDNEEKQLNKSAEGALLKLSSRCCEDTFEMGFVPPFTLRDERSPSVPRQKVRRIDPSYGDRMAQPMASEPRFMASENAIHVDQCVCYNHRADFEHQAGRFAHYPKAPWTEYSRAQNMKHIAHPPEVEHTIPWRLPRDEYDYTPFPPSVEVYPSPVYPPHPAFQYQANFMEPRNPYFEHYDSLERMNRPSRNPRAFVPDYYSMTSVGQVDRFPFNSGRFDERRYKPNGYDYGWW